MFDRLLEERKSSMLFFCLITVPAYMCAVSDLNLQLFFFLNFFQILINLIHVLCIIETKSADFEIKNFFLKLFVGAVAVMKGKACFTTVRMNLI